MVAHTSRAGHAKALAQQVKADFISFDNGLLGCDGNHNTVQHHLANLPSTWSLVLEDDAVPVESFRTQLEAALPMAPSPIVSLYYGRKRPPHWQTRMAKALQIAEGCDASWIVASRLLHAVGYAIRTELLPSLLDHDSDLPSDQHISNWAIRYGHLVSYTVPSLVDHADWPTIVDHPDGDRRTPGRTAWKAGTREHWSTSTVSLM